MSPRCASISCWVSPTATNTGQHMVTSARDRPADRAPASIIGSTVARRYSAELSGCRNTPSLHSPASRSIAGPTAAIQIGMSAYSEGPGLKKSVSSENW